MRLALVSMLFLAACGGRVEDLSPPSCTISPENSPCYVDGIGPVSKARVLLCEDATPPSGCLQDRATAYWCCD